MALLVKSLASSFIFISAVMMPVHAMLHSVYFIIRAGGKTLITLVFDCGFTWGLALPLAFVLSNFTALPIVPIFLSVQLLDAVKCLIGFILVKKGVWINNIVENY